MLFYSPSHNIHVNILFSFQNLCAEVEAVSVPLLAVNIGFNHF